MIVVLGIAIWGFSKGYRKGFVAQTASLLGLAFGVVVARLFGPEAEIWLQSINPRTAQTVTGGYMTSLVAHAIPLVLTYLVISLPGGILGTALSVFHFGTFDAIAGSLFGLFKNLVLLSLVIDAVIGFWPQGSIMKCASDDDGNLIHAVASIAPALAGNTSVSELAHRLQLEDAKRISRNAAPIDITKC